MNKESIPIYFVPGMCANEAIFEAIKLPENYSIHFILWKIPKEKETIQQYAKRMAAEVKKPNAVLLGVSFGGIMVQEMSRFLTLKKLIIVSSVKTKYELPRRFQLAKSSGLYKFLPTSLPGKIDNWQKLFFGETAKKIATVYRKYLTVTDQRYMDWAIENILFWEQEEPIENSIHIHGDADPIFPIKYIKDCINLKKGTHVIILSRARWFNENLPKLIES